MSSASEFEAKNARLRALQSKHKSAAGPAAAVIAEEGRLLTLDMKADEFYGWWKTQVDAIRRCPKCLMHVQDANAAVCHICQTPQAARSS
jgi:hypothetical protein